MKPKVKKCPFCGGTLMNLKRIDISRGGTRFVMLCCACLAQTGMKKTEEEAMVCWNMRHNDVYTGD